MAEETSYPYLAANKWWQVRNLFQRSLPSVVTVEYLLTNLGSEKPGVAREVLRNLRLLGLVNEEGRPTERANEWRMDNHYAEVCEQIRQEVYPRELLDSPDDSLNRNTMISWFMRNSGVGRGTAAKYIPIFEILREADPTQAPSPSKRRQTPSTRTRSKKKPQEKGKIVASRAANLSDVPAPQIQPARPGLPSSLSSPSVHVDVQIHISPDASSDQIDQIFASIAKHLYQARTLSDE